MTTRPNAIAVALAALFVLVLTVPVFGGRREVFATGTDRALWTIAFDGAAWGGWQKIGGEINGGLDAVAGPGIVDVFIGGTDKSIQHSRRTQGTWSSWFSLGGELDGPPGAVRLASGDIHVFAVGTDSALWHIAFRGGRWSGWESIGGEFGAIAPKAIDRGNGRLEVFARGKDQMVWSNLWDGSAWSDWNPINEGLIKSDPAVAPRADYTHLIALGTDNRLWHCDRGSASSGDWTGWGVWDEQRFDAGHNPDAAVDGNEEIVVIRGMDDAVHVRTAAGWSSLGGRILGDPAVVVAIAGSTAATAAPAPSGVYRVTINGFIVNRETSDDPLERDGARDEVYVEAHSVSVSNPRSILWNAVTRTFGDVHQHPTRIRAGSARGLPGVGADGGLMTGDSLPTRTPWARTLEPLRPVEPADGEVIDLARQGVPRLPMVAWEGTLVRGANAVVIVPAVIESDNRLQHSSRDSRHAADTVAAALSTQLIGATPANADALVRRAADAIAARVRYPRGPDPSDRPIGMQLEAGQYVWRTTPILLTYDLAEQLAQRVVEYADVRTRSDGVSQSVAQPLPRGVSFINWRDHSDLGGDYTLFWQIEKVR